MFNTTGCSHPGQLTTTALLNWILKPAQGKTHAANNTVRGRLSTARAFLKWCALAGHISHNPADLLPNLTKQYPTTYGKAQAARPARWLTTDQVAQLLAACQDGTWIGSRDQLTIRLGMLGLRATELRTLTWGNLLPDGRLTWIGKGNRPRSAEPGPKLQDLLARWRRKLEHELNRPVTASDPILCRSTAHRVHRPTQVEWGHGYEGTDAIRKMLIKRAAAAGLGHVAPHDLRRSAAGILHNTRTADGGHRYDLLDIQRVLDHADPTTTMKAYLVPMGDGAKASAGITLDL